MFFVIGVEAANGHKYTEVANNIDEAKFIMDRLHDTGVDEVHITKDVCVLKMRNMHTILN